jgi:hypothetical protein
MPPVSCERAMHNEPTAFVLRAAFVLHHPFRVVQTLLARYAPRTRLTSPLFANAWRTAANIVCLCYVRRDECSSTNDRTPIIHWRLPSVIDGCASCFNGKIICRIVATFRSQKFADWKMSRFMVAADHAQRNWHHQSYFRRNISQCSCWISWIQTRLTGRRSSITVGLSAMAALLVFGAKSSLRSGRRSAYMLWILPRYVKNWPRYGFLKFF